MAAKVQYNSDIYSKFFDFLQFCIGTSAKTCNIVGEKEWAGLFKIAEKQGLVGILYTGLERLDKGQGPKGEVLMRWIAQAQTIRNRNVQLFRLSADSVERFGKDGFGCCIL